MSQPDGIARGRALNHVEVVEWLRSQAKGCQSGGARAQTLLDTAAVLECLGPYGIQPSKGKR